MCCCSTRPARSPLATAWPRHFIPRRGHAEKAWPTPHNLASLADETPEGRSIVVLAKEKFGLRAREMHELQRNLCSLHRPDAHERRRSAARTATSRSIAFAKARPKRCAAYVGSTGGAIPAGRSRNSREISRRGGTPLVVAEGTRRARRGSAEGRGQGRNQGTVRAPPRDGHSHGDDHR